jgi:SAM-dependent methyltransferase
VSWQDEVRSRFSMSGSAKRWSDMYGARIEQAEDHFFRQRCEYTVNHVLAHCAPDATILDLGCGAGPVTGALRERGRHVIALDYSPDMLQLAARRLAGLRGTRGGLVQGDSRRLPFADGTLDAVVCLGVISYVQDYESVLREIRRVLKPDGRLVLSTRNEWNPRFFDPVEPVKAAYRRLRFAPRRPPVAIGRFLPPRDVDRRLAEEGFSTEVFTGMGFGPPRFNRRTLLSTPASVRLSDGMDRLFSRLNAHLPYRWLADVNLWICRPQPRG